MVPNGASRTRTSKVTRNGEDDVEEVDEEEAEDVTKNRPKMKFLPMPLAMMTI